MWPEQNERNVAKHITKTVDQFNIQTLSKRIKRTQIINRKQTSTIFNDFKSLKKYIRPANNLQLDLLILQRFIVVSLAFGNGV